MEVSGVPYKESSAHQGKDATSSFLGTCADSTEEFHQKSLMLLLFIPKPDIYGISVVKQQYLFEGVKAPSQSHQL